MNRTATSEVTMSRPQPTVSPIAHLTAWRGEVVVVSGPEYMEVGNFAGRNRQGAIRAAIETAEKKHPGREFVYLEARKAN